MADSDSATAQSPSPSPSPPAAPLAPVYFYFLLAPAFNPLSSPYVSRIASFLISDSFLPCRAGSRGRRISRRSVPRSRN
ncbi:unnamed protein product [Linum tenue]|uniref:Uncharacterized protein n=1 Tax=Linum tenue TaxID=586396 RepID=A0AAV0P8Y2_9ROSI|nr:unnamed protein product [Linum tenue]